MDKWFKDRLPDKDPYHNRGRDQMRKEVSVNLLIRKLIYDYMYPVDLENNERSCEYSAIVVPTSKDIVTQPPPR
jgi:hypothetical protein